MKVAILIPDRGDRSKFLENCLRMIAKQTLWKKADIVVQLENYLPESDALDITQRYRRGYDKLRGKGFDVIFLMENDDYYSPEYMETMLDGWERDGRPDLYGTMFTIYYHIELRGWFIMEHHQRASAMNTIIKPDLNLEWCVDHEPFTDLWLWQTIPNRIVFWPKNNDGSNKILSIGIKHGVGKTVPESSHVVHQRMISRYANEDVNFEWLRANMDPVSFEFYSTYFQHVPTN